MPSWVVMIGYKSCDELNNRLGMQNTHTEEFVESIGHESES
jgi:hypothetical protein